MGGYTVASSLEASEDKNDGSGSADDAEDDDDGSSSDDDGSSSSFEMRVVILIRGGIVQEIRGSVYMLRDVVRI